MEHFETRRAIIGIVEQRNNGSFEGLVEGKVVTLEEIKRVLEEHKEELRKGFQVKRVGIFGSYARGEATEASDVDIVVELYQPIGWEIVDLCEYLEKILNKKVELLTMGAAKSKQNLWKEIEKDLIYV